MTKEQFAELVGQSIGRASMCWEPLPEGVFDSTTASMLVDAICAEYNRLYDLGQGFEANPLLTPVESGGSVP